MLTVISPVCVAPLLNVRYSRTKAHLGKNLEVLVREAARWGQLGLALAVALEVALLAPQPWQQTVTSPLDAQLTMPLVCCPGNRQ